MADVQRPESRFRRSSRCSAGGCVEVALLAGGDAVVRDSADPNRKPLTFTKQGWCRFVSDVKNGHFDL